ncbi:hypothetical protein CH373_01070 [Leptospira perolatii]|uniref:Uncharacterized protein n=1 Tax=Leptospira perolatii TaxID=2023191 RepID=A0A2M9ZRW8_9LEPT|nr:hypothetical protein CH360_01070 [Leptospira perolatii]PJZ74673.1 hypothetical protein CH373_01070 [Leptospira perolatii]
MIHFTPKKAYQEEAVLREAFFNFTPEALYGASFREWFLRGGWTSKYISYSLFDERRIERL